MKDEILRLPIKHRGQIWLVAAFAVNKVHKHLVKLVMPLLFVMIISPLTTPFSKPPDQAVQAALNTAAVRRARAATGSMLPSVPPLTKRKKDTISKDIVAKRCFCMRNLLCNFDMVYQLMNCDVVWVWWYHFWMQGQPYIV